MERSVAQERLLLLACLSVLLVLAVFDATSTQRTLSGTYGLAPVLAAALLRTRLVLTCGVAAVVTSALSFLWNGNLGLDWGVRLVIVVALSVTAVVIATSRERRESRLSRITLIAEAAQRALLRAMPAAVGPVGFAARYVSATEEARIGGDLYEVVSTPFGTRAIVGDVRGKGLEAVQLAATVLGAFRRAAYSVEDLAGLARELDVVVTAVAEVEDFVTAVLVQFGDDSSLEVVNVGHLPPILIGGGSRDTATVLDTGDPVPPLGLHPDPVAVTRAWAPGMRLLLYTDGTTEGRDRKGQFFELTSAASTLGSGTLDEALDRLIAALTVHVGHALTDDVALVLAENNGGSAPARGPRS
ncbi:PP2C family protein-serine/threonine phosphatase [Oryzobacter telluris]|uniref:PP2C family protein-serine/threonine phosphatase n=1 Tax=Oryzobacter telluris TaxID=3149179 RepID=UPI00370D4164